SELPRHPQCSRKLRFPELSSSAASTDFRKDAATPRSSIRILSPGSVASTLLNSAVNSAVSATITSTEARVAPLLSAPSPHSWRDLKRGQQKPPCPLPPL